MIEALIADFEGFSEIELTPKLKDHQGDVYVLVFKKNEVEVPFYVGQTTRFLARMDDYFWAVFQAPTDFKVGTAIQYLCGELGGRVLAKHKLCEHPREEERRILQKLKGRAPHLPLLNGIEGYDYKTHKPEDVAERIRSKCREIAAFADAKQPAAD